MIDFDVIFWPILLLIIAAPIAIWADDNACHAKWQSRFPVSYDPVQGCLIDTGKGFIPADAYREIP